MLNWLVKLGAPSNLLRGMERGRAGQRKAARQGSGAQRQVVWQGRRAAPGQQNASPPASPRYIAAAPASASSAGQCPRPCPSRPPPTAALAPSLLRNRYRQHMFTVPASDTVTYTFTFGGYHFVFKQNHLICVSNFIE